MLIAFVLLAGIALAQVPMPPTAPVKKTTTVLSSPKAAGDTTTTMASPTKSVVTAKSFSVPNEAVPLFHVNYGPTNREPLICGVDGTNMVLILPTKTPMLYIPNKSTAAFAMLQSSPDLVNWTTLGYMTNFLNGFYIADVTSTNQPKYFYRLVPQ